LPTALGGGNVRALRRPVLPSAALAAALAAAGTARATPLDDPHLGGIGFTGPTTGDLTALYWNPGALGLLQGHQVLVAGTGRLLRTTVERAPVGGGDAGAGRSFAPVRGRGLSHPLTWPTGPGAFLGAAAVLANRFTVALGTYTPFLQRLSYPTAGDQPNRFHLVEADLRSVAVVPALALRLGPSVRIGVAPGFLFSVGRLVFDEDAALETGAAGLPRDCGGAPCEDAARAARYDLGTGLSPFDSTLSFTLSGGIHIRRPRWDLGLAYHSRPFGNEGQVELDGRRSSVTPPASAPDPLCPPLAPGAGPPPCTFASLRYALPNTYIAGLTVHLDRRWDVSVMARYLAFARHEAVSLRIVGPPGGGLRARGLPESIRLYRGWQDALDLRLRATVQATERLRISATLRGETSAVPPRALSPAAVDAPKLEPALALQLRVTRGVRLQAGYALTLALPTEAERSVFDPAAAIACAERGGDLDAPACAQRREGTARPTARGRYRFDGHALSVSVSAEL
jgi:long-subunit fatty acid transport protein